MSPPASARCAAKPAPIARRTGPKAASAIVASGGTLAGAIVAAGLAGGSGGLFGSALARFLEDRHVDYLRDQLDRGGILLWVRCRDQAHEVRACGILAAHSAHHVHIHSLTAA
ncbi:MAG: hypothetical protein FJX67_17945 [Alphaproteobacteria bacterium]|nr:hypothetical protein [Alphaproteobacteria bacterium]